MRRARFVGAVAQPHHPVGRMLLVVARFLHRLAGDGGEFASLESRSRSHSSWNQVAIIALRSTVNGEVAARQLDERDVAVVALLAQEGELVFVVALAFELRRRA